MLAIARAVMAKPRLILLDEASLGLAPSTAKSVYEAIARLRAESGIAMVVVEQLVCVAEATTGLHVHVDRFFDREGASRLAEDLDDLLQVTAVHELHDDAHRRLPHQSPSCQ